MLMMFQLHYNPPNTNSFYGNDNYVKTHQRKEEKSGNILYHVYMRSLEAALCRTPRVYLHNAPC